MLQRTVVTTKHGRPCVDSCDTSLACHKIVRLNKNAARIAHRECFATSASRARRFFATDKNKNCMGISCQRHIAPEIQKLKRPRTESAGDKSTPARFGVQAGLQGGDRDRWEEGYPSTFIEHYCRDDLTTNS